MADQSVGLGSLLRSDDDPQDDPVARRAAKDAVRNFFKAIGTGNLESLATAVTDDVIYEFPFSETGSTEPGKYRRYVGRDEVLELWSGNSDLGIQNHGAEDVELSVLGDGSRLFIEQRGNLTMGNGRHYRNRYIFRFDIQDGLVSGIREYFNPIISAYAFERPIAGGQRIDFLD
jgi:ketosteroid isomerase-like protein